MKKFKLVILILIMVVAIGVIVLFVTMRQVSNKKPITEQEFAELLSNYNIEATDISGTIQTPIVERLLVGKVDGFHAELYLCSSDDTAKALFNENKESMKISAGSYSVLSLGNYGRCKLTTGDKFYYLARIDNTILLVYSFNSDKENVLKLASEMGY